jgi:hypothetical protein
MQVEDESQYHTVTTYSTGKTSHSKLCADAMKAQNIRSTDQHHVSEPQDTIGRSTRDESDEASFEEAGNGKMLSSDMGNIF